MTRRRTIPRPQFALRTLVIGGLLLGSIGGLYGPTLVRSIRIWMQPPATNVQQPFVLPLYPKKGDWDSSQTGYFESAESPLR